MHGKPEIINTDQGSQFTAEEFSSFVLGQDIRLSMDRKGRATDNAFIEILWRKHQIRKNLPKNGLDLYLKVNEYFNYYNHKRGHQSLNYEKPASWYQTVA